jgi:probable DNA metabolism protein
MKAVLLHLLLLVLAPIGLQAQHFALKRTYKAERTLYTAMAYLPGKDTVIVGTAKGDIYFCGTHNDKLDQVSASGLKNIALLTISRERHRMEAFIRFEKTKDNIFYAGIDPDFNVLPLLIQHFKRRYADQEWIIYDKRRKYGIYYDKNDVKEIALEMQADASYEAGDNTYAEDEKLYQLLWQTYFKNTYISSRRNMKLHLRHVPKRYWKYLTEKQMN